MASASGWMAEVHNDLRRVEGAHVAGRRGRQELRWQRMDQARAASMSGRS